VYQHATQTTGTRPGFVDAFYVPDVTAGVTIAIDPSCGDGWRECPLRFQPVDHIVER